MRNHHTLFIREMPRKMIFEPAGLDTPILWGVYDEAGQCYGSSFDKNALYQWAVENDVQFATIH